MKSTFSYWPVHLGLLAWTSAVAGHRQTDADPLRPPQNEPTANPNSDGKTDPNWKTAVFLLNNTIESFWLSYFHFFFVKNDSHCFSITSFKKWQMFVYICLSYIFSLRRSTSFLIYYFFGPVFFFKGGRKMKNKAGGLCSHTPFHFTILSYLSLEGDRFFPFPLQVERWTWRIGRHDRINGARKPPKILFRPADNQIDTTNRRNCNYPTEGSIHSGTPLSPTFVSFFKHISPVSLWLLLLKETIFNFFSFLPFHLPSSYRRPRLSDVVNNLQLKCISLLVNIPPFLLFQVACNKSEQKMLHFLLVLESFLSR